MQSVYYLNTTELSIDFLQAIKTLFTNKNIQITVAECFDETEYLLQSKSNSRRLLQAVENINKGENLVEMSIEQLKKLTNEESNF